MRLAFIPRRVDWFLSGMLVAVGLAILFPDPGAAGGWMQPKLLTKGGVALIFFLHGVAMSFAAMRDGASRWRLHLLAQSATFLLFPALGLMLMALAGGAVTGTLRTGFFYLCALPSTVSSSVAMTAAARGNVPAAVFNATLSSLIGVVVTPALMAWYLEAATEGGQSLGAVILDLMLWLVLPLVVGQVSRRWLAGWASRNKKTINVVDKGTILLLVYTSFCDSVKMGIWGGHMGDAAWALLGSVILFVLVMAVVGGASDLMGFAREDRIAAIFCGSKKTLASGVPMAAIMFGDTPDLGIILLPIMIYHPFQLIVCGVLAERWGRRATASPGVPPAVGGEGVRG